MHIHIFGASGSGVTTLGYVLGTRLDIPYFDADDYYWLPTEPPFQLRRNPIERNLLLRNELRMHPDWILGGSLDSWGDEWPALFDQVIFLWIPTAIRVERLRKRELERYGQQLLNNPQWRQQSEAFINWSADYDSGLVKGRSKPRHEAWMRQLSCPTLRIEGDLTVEERVTIILDSL